MVASWSGGLCQDGIGFEHLAILRHFGQRGQGADSQASCRSRTDALQRSQPVQADEAIRLEYAVAETAEQVGAARHDAGSGPTGGVDGLCDGRRSLVRKLAQHGLTLWSSAREAVRQSLPA